MVQIDHGVDTAKMMTQAATSMGLGILTSALGAPEFAGQAMAIGGALGGAGYDYMYPSEQQALTY